MGRLIEIFMDNDIALRFRFRGFKVYKDVRLFIADIKKLVKEKFPSSEQFMLTSQILKASYSILLNIAEGSERGSDKDFARFLNTAQGSLSEVVACLDAASDSNYIDAVQHEILLGKAFALANQLVAFRRKLLWQPGRPTSHVPSPKSSPGFTLPELLIAVSIFATVSTIVAGLYITSFRTNRTTTEQNRIYEDARFIMNRIADEIRTGMVDYDEYYNQYVVSKAAALSPVGAAPFASNTNPQNYGQNYGRYYSAFFNPGVDQALGFDCNNIPPQFVEGSANPAAMGPIYNTNDQQTATQPPTRNAARNKKDCVPLRRTIDRHTGQNPFVGKDPSWQATDENAFCGVVAYQRAQTRTRGGRCVIGTGAPLPLNQIRHRELYLISQDGRTKTILALEMIGGTPRLPVNALALLRMKGLDCSGQDGVPDMFVCADEFQCTTLSNGRNVTAPNVSNTCPGTGQAPAPLPLRSDLLTENTFENAANAYSLDFVPISPLTVNISRLNFIISPAENPHYAFSEEAERSTPRVTIVLTVEANPAVATSRDSFAPITLIETVSPRVLARIPTPLLVVP